MSTVCYSSATSAASARHAVVGELHLLNVNGKSVATRQLYARQELTIGRDRTRCQWVFEDPYLSAKHVRMYNVVYDNEDDGGVEYLVYAEDLSRHGTFWNDSVIGKGNGGFLLSHNDKLRLSSKTSFYFTACNARSTAHAFDLRQETEMARFRNEYVVTDRLLGSGTFGQVFMAVDQRSKTQVACKIIDLRSLKHTKSNHFSAPKHPLQAGQVDQKSQTNEIEAWASRQRKDTQRGEQLKVCYREIETLSKLNHPNIIGLAKVYITDSTIYLFQDLVTAGDLFSYLEFKNGKLPEVEAAVIIHQVLVALQFLHDQGIVHRDLKPENIMMTSLSAGCRIVLTDFGAARRLKPCQRMTSLVGSDQYAAPEVKTNHWKNGSEQAGYTKAVDMWSVGTIAVVLLTGGSAFSDPSTGQYSPLLARSCNLQHFRKSKEWQILRPRPQDFISQLLTLGEERRMTAQQALEHIWFNNEMHKTDFEQLYQRAIRHWHPRVAKLPIIETMRPNVVEHLVPHSTRRNTSRLCRGKQPVEPPYKPFPRKMHVPLWPERSLSSHEMSRKVKTAIAELWTDALYRPARRFKVDATSRVIEPAAIVACPPQPGTLASEDLDQKQMRHCSLLSPLHVSQNKADNVVQQTVTRFRSSKIRSKLAKDTETCQAGAGPESSVSRRRGLSRSTTSLHAESKPSKRWRDSMFSLNGDNDCGDSSDDDSEALSCLTNKRQKTTDTSHNSRMPLLLETMNDNKPYLPRI